MTYLILFLIAYHIMIVSNNSYFHEFNLDFKTKRKSLLNGESIVYDSAWKGLYLLFKGFYVFALMVLFVICIFKGLPYSVKAPIGLLLGFEFLKSSAIEKGFFLNPKMSFLIFNLSILSIYVYLLTQVII